MSEPSNSGAETVVKLGTPRDLVAALPSLLGFVPTRSLVAIAVRDHGGRSQLGAMVRADLPEPGDVPDQYVEAVVRRLTPTDPSWVQLVVVSDADHGGRSGEHDDPPPEAWLVDMIRASFAAAAIAAPSPLWTANIVAGAPWRCYDECGCSGVLPDPEASVVAATSAVTTGQVVYRSREEAEADLAPDADADSHPRRWLIDNAHWAAVSARVRDSAAAAGADLDVIRGAIADSARGTSPSEEVLARIAVALQEPAVRDVCIGFSAGRDPRVEPGHATQMWQRLTRALPAPEVAEPATLLAFAALRRGGGVTLSVALDRARRADPEHRLSGLLDHALSIGMSVGELEAAVLDAVRLTEDRNRHH